MNFLPILGGVLYLALLVSGQCTWTCETIETDSGADMSIASFGDVAVVSYVDAATSDSLRYSIRSGGTWSPETVNTTDSFKETSIADINGTISIAAHMNGTHDDLIFCQRDGSWSCIVLEDAGASPVGRYVSLIELPNRQPGLSYYHSTLKTLKWAERNASGWFLTTVAATGDVGKYSSSVLLPNGEPAIFYQDKNANPKTLRYAWRSGGVWSNMLADSSATDDFGKEANAAIVDGQPACVHYNGDGKNLRYTRYNGTAFNSEVVDSAGKTGEHPALTCVNGYPMAAYYDETDTVVRFANGTGGSWTLTAIETSTDTGTQDMEIAVINGTLGVAYHNKTDARYCVLTPSCVNETGSCGGYAFATVTQETVTETQPTATATQPTVTATQATLTATQPTATATQVSATATQPTVTATQATVTATQVTATATQVSVTATQATLTATQPTATATQVSATATQPTLTATQPTATATQVSATATQATLTATQPTVTATQATVTATQVTATVTQVSATATQPTLTATQPTATVTQVSATATQPTITATQLTATDTQFTVTLTQYTGTQSTVTTTAATLTLETTQPTPEPEAVPSQVIVAIAVGASVFGLLLLGGCFMIVCTIGLGTRNPPGIFRNKSE